MQPTPTYARNLATLTLASLALWRPAAGAPPPLSVPVSGAQNPDGTQGFSGILGNLERTNYLLGDLFGVRTELSKFGISLAIQETSEVLGNATGGVRRGLDYDGLTQAILQLDTQRAFGLYGGLLNISALQLHGRNLSADNLLTLQTASGIEGDRATRLWERRVFREHHVRLAAGAVRGPARRRPRLSALRPGRAPALSPGERRDDPRRRIQRQPGPHQPG
jgi:carbohydrate-selective porin OprB